MRKVGVVCILAAALVAAARPAAGQYPPVVERVTLDEAVARAVARNLDVAQAAQAILRAEALLQQARVVYQPTVNAAVTTTILDDERGFEQFVTQPQVQSLFSASAAYPVLAASRWAAAAQAGDQVRVARLGADEVRRQVAIATAQAYLAVIAQQRQVEVNERARENAIAHLDFASARLQAGAGSRLNELRAAEEVATDEVLLEASLLAVRNAEEALGVLLAAPGPIGAAGDPVFETPSAPAGETWLADRRDVQLFTAQVDAADRVVRDSWKDWVPTGVASFEPQGLWPAGLFQPARTWRAVVQFAVPVFDGGSRRALRRQREVARSAAQIALDDVTLRARAELRIAQAAVARGERALEAARRAAANASEVLSITDVAFRAGATTNLELVDAQRRARDADTRAAQAEDRLRQARLDLLVALGRFPG